MKFKPARKFSQIFQRISLKKKFLLILVLTSGLSIFLASTVLVLNDLWHIRESLVGELVEQAGLVGENSSAALVFQDKEAAQEILSVFRHQPNILQAVLFSPKGGILSQYQPGIPPDYIHLSSPVSSRLSWESIEVFRKIYLDEKHVGTIYLLSNLRPVYQRFDELLLVSLVALILSSLLSLVISARLQKAILLPLEKLTTVATRISENQDFSLRAPTHSPDEIGTLIDGFNTMLQEIQDRDQELGQHRHHLSSLVEERTTELSKANTLLQDEITERQRIAQQVQGMASDLKIKNEELAISRDAALQAVKAKSDFLATMSHEIRTPMNGILGMTGLLIETTLTPQQYSLANTVKGSAHALLTLLNDILDFSKIEAGKLEFESIDFNLGVTVEDSLDLLAERASSKNIELTGIIFPDVPTSLKGDPGRLRQILLNLIGNAIKFTTKGEVSVQILLAEENETEVELRFHIWDTGEGITQDVKDKLFKAFSQADSSTTRKFGGTGLGLAICKQLVDLMRGQIGVESQPNEWTLFWFSVPFQKHPVRQTHTLTSRKELQDLRICCIDDNPTNLFLLQTYTQEWGMQPFITVNPEEGFNTLCQAAADKRPFHLVILDRNFPEYDGLQLAKRIKSESSISQTKLVLLTSFGQRGEATDAQQAGFDAYLTKPIHKLHLHDSLSTVMGFPDSHTSSHTRPLVTRHTIKEAQRQLRLKILIADDHAINQQLLVLLLERLGLSCDVVMNGKEAVQAALNGSYALILMDCQMPEMDGYEATRKIRSAEAEKNTDESESQTVRSNLQHVRIPIVALTANAMPGDREKCLAAGMDEYLSKPINPEELEMILARLLPSTLDDNPYLSMPQRENDNSTDPKFLPLPKTQHQVANPDENTPKETNPSPMNLAQLQEWQELGGPDFMKQMLEQFVSDVDACVREIEHALDQGDHEALAEGAHGLKGICANIGATDLQALAKNLEEFSRQGKPIDSQQTIQNLQTAVTHITTFLTTLQSPQS